MRLPGQRITAGQRGDIDDVAALGRDHHGREGLDGEKGPRRLVCIVRFHSSSVVS